MIVDIGYYLSAAIALTIVLVGAYFLVAPYAAAEGFGVTVVRGRWNATYRNRRYYKAGLWAHCR